MVPSGVDLLNSGGPTPDDRLKLSVSVAGIAFADDVLRIEDDPAIMAVSIENARSFMASRRWSFTLKNPPS